MPEIFETPAAPPVPEPPSIVLMGSVIVGVVTLLKRKMHSRTS